MQKVAIFISVALAGAVDLNGVRAADAAPSATFWERSLRAAQDAADKGEFDRARELLVEQVATLENSHTNRYRLIMTLNELGLLYSSLGQFSSAERVYRRAIRVAEQSPAAGGLA